MKIFHFSSKVHSHDVANQQIVFLSYFHCFSFLGFCFVLFCFKYSTLNDFIYATTENKKKNIRTTTTSELDMNVEVQKNKRRKKLILCSNGSKTLE